MKEIWKDITGYENEYQISNLARVKALSRVVKCRGWKTRIIKEKILKPGKGSNGYLIVALFRQQKQDCRTVHRLVATAFIPNPENKRTINHINGIKTDNRIENLEWCTYSENGRHSVDVLKNKYGSSAKLSEESVREIRRIYREGKLSTNKIAAMYNMKGSSIWSVVNNKTWKHVI